MKFVCDQCKAKYQISDEKVVGKTVKMKCRKCGHMIEVRAAVTETSVATSSPKDPAEERQHTSVSTSSPPDHAITSGSTAPPPRPAGGPPRPMGGPTRTSSLATSLAAQRPAPPRAAPAAPVAQSALAGAFSRSVQKEDDPAPGYDLREISGADEWYAAINGVPVGPIRVTELRRKAALGAVTEESLVWQEGLEEWRPVRAFPELAEMVREAAAIGRPSLLPPPAWEAPPPEKPVMTGRPGSVRPAGPPPRAPAPLAGPPRPATIPQAKNNVIPMTSRMTGASATAASAAAERIDEISVAVMPPEGATPAPAPLPMPPPMASPDPFAMPPPAQMLSPHPAPFAAFTPSPSISAPPAPLTSRISASEVPKKPVPWIPIAMVVLAGAFGVTFCVILFLPKPASPVAAPAPSVLIIHDPAPTVAVEPSAVAAPTPSAAPERRGASNGGGQRAAAAPQPSATGKGGYDLGSMLGGPGGPNVGGTGPGTGGGGGSLTQNQIEAVVASRKVAIRRACLERTESTNAGNVSVKAKVTVGGSGTVQSVSTQGNDPIIGACIEKNLRGWSFPPTGGTTTFEIPFAFVRQ